METEILNFFFNLISLLSTFLLKPNEGKTVLSFLELYPRLLNETQEKAYLIVYLTSYLILICSVSFLIHRIINVYYYALQATFINE